MESEVAGLRDFLGSEWLQDDTLDACDRLLQEASDIYEAAEVTSALPRARPQHRHHTPLYDSCYCRYLIDIYKTANEFNIKMT